VTNRYPMTIGKHGQLRRADVPETSFVTDEDVYAAQLHAVDDPEGHAAVLDAIRIARRLVELRCARHGDEDQRAWALARTKMDEALMWAEKATEGRR
jgi:hypothetical protein